MYDYELHQVRSAELRRRAEHERLAREAGRVARREAAERDAPGEGGAEPGPHRPGPRRSRFARAA